MQWTILAVGALVGVGCAGATASEPGQSTAPTAGEPGTPRADGAADDRPTVEVAFERGKIDFLEGDRIEIGSVRGDRSSFEVGGRYTVTGTYRLGSTDRATLAVYVTNGNVTGDNRIIVAKGDGPFSLTFQIEATGYPHVSFYPVPSGNGFGGVYFGSGETLYAKP